ncbi:hypothetical protein NBRC116495_22470 [Aurantivibrio plasticivorans]
MIVASAKKSEHSTFHLKVVVNKKANSSKNADDINGGIVAVEGGFCKI